MMRGPIGNNLYVAPIGDSGPIDQDRTYRQLTLGNNKIRLQYQYKSIITDLAHAL